MLGGWEGTGGSLAFCCALHPHKDEVTWWQQPLLCLSLCFLNAFFPPMSSGKPEQEELWQRLQHPPAPGEQAVRDGEVGISIQEERWVRMSIICPENSWLHPGVAVDWENVVLVGGPRAGTSRGRSVCVRFLVTVRQVYRCNWSRLVLSIYQCLENGIFPQAGGDPRVGG